MPIQMPQGQPNQVHSFPGAPDGVNQSIPQSEIKDSQGYIIQDAFVNEPSYMIRRGPVRNAIGTPNLTYKGSGLATAKAPDDQVYLAAFTGDDTHGKMEIFDTSLSSIAASLDWDNIIPTSPNYLIFHAQPALNKGTMIGISDTYGLRTGAGYASGRLEFADSITSAIIDKTITIGTITYTFKGSVGGGAPANQINGPGAGTEPGWHTASRLANAINAGPGAGTDYSAATTQNPDVAATANGNVVNLQARAAGTAGNGFETSSTIPGAAHSALYAVDSKASVADHADLSPTTRISLTGWFKPTTLNAASAHTVILKDSAFRLRLVKVGSAYRWQFSIFKSGVWVDSTDTVDAAVDTLYYIAGLYTTSRVQLYVNNSLKGNVSTSGNINDSANDLDFGATSSGFIGYMDDVALFKNATLSTTRMTAHYNEGNDASGDYQSVVMTDTPVAFWAFDAEDTPTFNDRTGNGHDLTMVTGHEPTLAQTSLIAGDSGAALLVLDQDELDGGVDGVASAQTLGYWNGGASPTRTDTNVTVSRGGTTVTGSGTSWLSNLTPGMWVISTADNALVGCVESIESNTSLTLADPALIALAAASAQFVAVRGIYPRVRTGTITCANSDPTVTGGDTKFKDQGIGNGTWDLFRARDLTWIGTVSSVTNNISLELSANAAIDVSEEAYVAIKRGLSTLYTKVTSDPEHLGFITTVWAGHQWFANRSASLEETYRLWFSHPDDPESVDISDTGDWFTIPSAGNVNTPLIGMAPCYNGLAIFKSDESFLLSGTTPEDFQLRKMINDGLLSTTGVAIYKSGVIWPGRDGIYYYKGIGTQYLEGIDIANLTESTLGFNWRRATQNFDPNSQRMWGLVAHDHYFLFTEEYASPVPLIKGNTVATPANWTIVINLLTGSLTFLSNVSIRGGVNLVDVDGAPTYYLVNTDTEGRVCSSLDLFYSDGLDEFDTDAGTAGPDYYFESKKFPMEDPLILKRVKQITFHHLNDGDAMKVDVIPGLNNTGTTLTGTLHDTLGLWKVSRLRFSKKTQYFSFRLYQASGSIQRVNLGPFQLKYKPLRPGRV